MSNNALTSLFIAGHVVFLQIYFTDTFFYRFRFFTTNAYYEVYLNNKTNIFPNNKYINN